MRVRGTCVRPLRSPLRRGGCRRLRRRQPSGRSIARPLRAGARRRLRSRSRRSGRDRRRPAAEVLDAADQVTIAGPANGVAFAPSLAAWVEQEDAVTMADEHPSLIGARRARKEDHSGAVLRSNVRRRQLERVARGDLDALIRDSEIRSHSGPSRVRVDVRIAHGENDERQRDKAGEERYSDRARPSR